MCRLHCILFLCYFRLLFFSTARVSLEHRLELTTLARVRALVTALHTHTHTYRDLYMLMSTHAEARVCSHGVLLPASLLSFEANVVACLPCCASACAIHQDNCYFVVIFFMNCHNLTRLLWLWLCFLLRLDFALFLLRCFLALQIEWVYFVFRYFAGLFV